MERRTFLATASLSPLFRPLATPQVDARSFKTAEIDVAGNKIFMRRYGQGPGILMVHTLSADQPDVAIPCAEACGQSHSNLRRLARLRSKWDTRFDG